MSSCSAILLVAGFSIVWYSSNDICLYLLPVHPASGDRDWSERGAVAANRACQNPGRLKAWEVRLVHTLRAVFYGNVHSREQSILLRTEVIHKQFA